MIILITGGASGLGEAITHRLAKDSHNSVYFTYHTSNENAERITNEYSNTFSINCDFGNENDIASLQVLITQLDIDVLINNAYSGTFLQSHFNKIPVDSFLSEFSLNILPTIAVTQAAITCFRKKKSGKIITILTSALKGTPPIGSSVYVANKAYLEELTKVWAAENVKFNISSNSVSPSFMLTGFTINIDERLVEQMREQNPSKKILTTDEVAASVLSIVKAKQDVNGINFVINSSADVI